MKGTEVRVPFRTYAKPMVRFRCEAAHLLRHPQRLEDAGTPAGRRGRLLHRGRRPGHLGQRHRALRRDSGRRAATRSTCCRAITNRPTRSPACARGTACTISTSAISRWATGTSPGLGYSNPTPFNTPGEYSEPQIAERLAAVRRSDSAGAGLPRAALRHRARPDPPGPARRLARRCASSSTSTSPSTSSAATSTRPKAWPSRWAGRARSNVGKAGLFVRIGLNPMTLEELERAYQPLRDQALAVRRYL